MLVQARQNMKDDLDIALHYGSPSDANLYGFKICNVPVLLSATQEFHYKNGTPEHPHDLPSHNGLIYQLYDIILKEKSTGILYRLIEKDILDNSVLT